MHEFSSTTEKAREGLTQVFLETREEYPEITQELLSQITLVSQSQISRYINGEQPMPVTFVMALKDDDRTRPLFIAIMKYMGGFKVQVAENYDAKLDGEPLIHDIVNAHQAIGEFTTSVDNKRPAAARKALEELKRITWALELKSLDGKLRKIK